MLNGKTACCSDFRKKKWGNYVPGFDFFFIQTNFRKVDRLFASARKSCVFEASLLARDSNAALLLEYYFESLFQYAKNLCVAIYRHS